MTKSTITLLFSKAWNTPLRHAIQKHLFVKQRLVFFCAVLIVFLYAVLVTYSFYVNGFFGFYDVGLINDWLNNAFQGRPFYNPQYAKTHLGKHFTPSLLLLLPLYLVTDSQYMLLLIGSGCLAWTLVEIVLFAKTYMRWHYQTELETSPWYWAILAYTVVLIHTLYPKTVLFAGHFEIFFVPLALRTINSFVRSNSGLTYYISLFAAAGVRQDAGLFLLTLLLAVSLHFAPKPQRWMSPKRLIYSCLILLSYLALVMFTLMPHFGTDQNVQLWSSWGNSWSNIAFNLLTNPTKLGSRLIDSGFFPLLTSFGFFPLLGAPILFLLAHLPSLAIYTLDDSVRRHLFWYNSAFLLPSCFIFASIAFLKIVHWQKRKNFKRSSVAITMFLVVCFGIILSIIAPKNATPAYKIRTRTFSGSAIKKNLVQELVSTCKKGSLLAADFYTFTYLPLGNENYLLNHWGKADMVLFDPRLDASLPFNFDSYWLEQHLQEAGYRKVHSSKTLVAYVAPHSHACRR